MKVCTIVLTVVFSFSVVAGERVERDEFGRRTPADPTDMEVVDLYLSLSDLSLQDQRDQTWAMPSQTKAALWRYNIERYLSEHPAMTAEAQAVLREGIAVVSIPDWFDIEPGDFGYEMKTMVLDGLKERAETTLSPETIAEVFIRLGREPERDGETEKTSPVRIETNAFACSCGSQFDCGSAIEWNCYDAWCFTVYHCGWYSNEVCWGKCKATGQ